MTKIRNTFNKNIINDRTIYNNFNDFTEDLEIEWKFKNNVPTNFLIGFGYTASPFTIKGSVLNDANGLKIYYSDNSANNMGVAITPININTVLKIKTNNLHGFTWYEDDTVVAYRSTKNNFPLHLRIDDFNKSPIDLEYLMIRKI